MRAAIEQAMLAEAIDEVPIGAVIVRDEEVIAAAHNTRETEKNPLCHAEISAIARAAEVLCGWRLPGCTLYVTLEPCPMCAGAVINARIPRVVFGAYDKKAGAFGTLYDLAEGKLNHKPEVAGGILEKECAQLLSSYFRKKRKRGV
ncbi:tRNA adenosine(34) deaminase TadA [Christensenella tenuis]|uniref:tRNA-specific adenosine deaminase n=1 Tax=Christensenella tenuis TaxID=2763033 RepID=A0ABR7EJH6_9FIRM|nr:tRNA adenosine(34) deaminase TadA [Christensenella tenuis]MBC5649164.1 nucleoside deaminase [Christensenella tenuis]